MSGCEAAFCFLGCLPSPAFQAVVDCLDGPDIASLRLASTNLRHRTTHSTRSIVLRLSGAGRQHISTAEGGQHSSTPDSSSINTDNDQQQQQLQAWKRATHRFAHVPAVHVRVSGALSTQQWSAALRGLALRGNIKTLHITPAAQTHVRSTSTSTSTSSTSNTSPGATATAASIPSLLPVRQLLAAGLTELSVTGVTVTNMADDVSHFLAPSAAEEDATPASASPSAAPAAAAVCTGTGFKGLRSLNLSCGWSPSGSLRQNPAAFTAAMQAIPHTFPGLTHLTLVLPGLTAPVGGRHNIAAAANNQPGAAAGGGDAAAVAAANMATAAAAARASAAAEHAQMQGSMLAAAVAAAAALPKLQTLNLLRVPDIWATAGQQLPHAAPFLSHHHAATTAAAVGAASAAAAAGEGEGGMGHASTALLLPPPPAAAFKTLDGLGSWLLLQLPHLSVLRIEPVGATCCMSWNRTPLINSSSSGSGSRGCDGAGAAAGAAIPAPAIQLTYHAAMQPPAATVSGAAPTATSSSSSSSGGDSSGSSSSSNMLLSDLLRHLSRYTKRPAAETLPNITSLAAAIRPDQLPTVATAINSRASSLRGLTHLKLTVLVTSSCPTDFAALVAAATAAGAAGAGAGVDSDPAAAAAGGRGGEELAAAAAGSAGGGSSGLRSLTLLPGLGRVELTPTALLPLLVTCSASLRELKLIGNFGYSSSSSSNNSNSSSGDGNKGSAASTPAAPAAAAAAAWAVLRQMQGLEVLKVHQVGPEVLDLPVDCLPAGLRVLEVKRVQLMTSCTTAGADAAAAGSKSFTPALESLSLHDCRLDSSSSSSVLASLASRRLRQLSVAATELLPAGGWEAAVAAWPQLRGLSVWCPPSSSTVKHGSSGSSSSGRLVAGLKHGRKTAAATAARGEGSVRLLHGLAGFKQLQGLEVQHLPQLNPRVLQVLTQGVSMPRLSHLSLSAVGTSDSLTQWGHVACSRSSSSRCGLKYVSLRLPAVLPPAVTAQLSGGGGSSSSGVGGSADGVVIGSGGSGSSSGGSGGSSSSSKAVSTAGGVVVEPGVLERGLLAALPWCGVSVAMDVCAGYPRC